MSEEAEEEAEEETRHAVVKDHNASPISFLAGNQITADPKVKKILLKDSFYESTSSGVSSDLVQWGDVRVNFADKPCLFADNDKINFHAIVHVYNRMGTTYTHQGRQSLLRSGGGHLAE